MTEPAEYADELAAAHAELSRRQSFTDALLETINLGIVSCDADGHFVVSNRAQRELFGFQSELRGLWMGDIEPHIDVFDTTGQKLSPEQYPLMRALRGGDVSAEDVLVGPAGGPWREIVVRATQIIGPEGDVLGAVAALTDVSAERSIARALVAERRRLEEAQRIAKLGSFEHDFRTGAWSYSVHLSALWGLEGDQMAPQVRSALIHEHDRGHADDAWFEACRSGGRHTYDYRIRRSADGVELLLRTDVEIELDDEGQPVIARGTQLDVTDVKLAELEAKRVNAFFDAVLNASPDYTYVSDVATGEILYGSRDKHVLGITTDQFTALGGGDGVEALVHPEDQARLRLIDGAATGLADGAVLQVRYRGKHADGSWCWLNRRTTPFRRDEAGGVVEVLAVVRDISEAVDAEELLSHAATHDGLTGLPHRGVLMERLEAALARSERDWREVAVLFIDLDGFKAVNDTAGHAAGDAVLLETAKRLRRALREGDVVARVGGDEFVIVVECNEPSLANDGAGVPGQIDRLARQLADRVVAELHTPIDVGGVGHSVTASIGVAYATRALGDGSSVSADGLLRAADAAMYVAKSNGKDRVSFYES